MLGGLNGVLVLADTDHGVHKRRRHAQHVFQIVDEHGVSDLFGLAQQVSVHEDIAFDADGVVEFGFLHLRLDERHELSDIFLVLGRLRYVTLAEFSRSRQDFRERFDQGVLVESVMVPGVSVVHDVLLAELGRIRIVAPDAERNDADHDNQVYHQYEIPVVGVQQEVGQTDTDFQGLFAVRVSVLFVVLAGLFVRQGLVGF
mmetsp:Transcript_4041/g.5912  ORF Transcript_4041/g.5912 Transcript_4041/m.5912 type:complete len:201 (-) Transcript_4041:591-1193(-)